MTIDIRNDEYEDAASRLNGRYLKNGHPAQPRIFTDVLGWGLWVGKYTEYRYAGKDHEAAIRAVENMVCATEGKSLPFPPAPTPEPVPGRTGPIRLDGRCMVDDQGPSCFVGATYFPLAWMVQHDLSRANLNLRWMADRGIQFVRALAEVGGPTWSDRVIDPRTPEWTQQIRAATGTAKDCGLRVEWTLFGGGVLTKDYEYSQATDRFIEAITPYIASVQFVEIRNESNGPDDALARMLAARVRAYLSSVPVAISGTPEADLPAIYQGSRATVATFHPDRAYAERGYRPIRQIKHEMSGLPDALVNGEPIGIDSSVAAECDPILLAAGAITSWICNAAAHVFHHGAGIRGGGLADLERGRKANVWEQPTMEQALSLISQAKLRLPADLPNWTRQTHGWPTHPLQFATPVGDEVECDADVHGCNRAYAALAQDGRWVCFIAGIQHAVEFNVGGPMSVWSLSNSRVEHVPAGGYILSVKDWGPCALLSSE